MNLTDLQEPRRVFSRRIRVLDAIECDWAYFAQTHDTVLIIPTNKNQ